MKLTHKSILACALATGLMTVGAGSAKAIVIDDEVFTPLTIYMTAFTTPNEDNGKLVKVRIINKDILNQLSDFFDENLKGDQIAIGIFDTDSLDGDVVVLHHNTIDEDLSIDDGNGNLDMEFNEVVESDTESNHKEKYSESGDVELSFYSDPRDDEDDTYFEGDEEDFDTGNSEDASDVWFELTGSYHYIETDTLKNNNHINNDKVQVSTTLKTSLNGEGFDDELDNFDDDTVPVSGTVTGTGSGSVEEP